MATMPCVSFFTLTPPHHSFVTYLDMHVKQAGRLSADYLLEISSFCDNFVPVSVVNFQRPLSLQIEKTKEFLGHDILAQRS